MAVSLNVFATGTDMFFCLGLRKLTACLAGTDRAAESHQGGDGLFEIEARR